MLSAYASPLRIEKISQAVVAPVGSGKFYKQRLRLFQAAKC